MDAKKVLSLILAGPVAIALLSFVLGQDANWDLKNYHLYVPYAVIHGRLTIDHNAAGIQTYSNPTLDLLTTYPLFRVAGPVGHALFIGALQGLNVIILVLIVTTLQAGQDSSSSHRFSMALLAAFLGISGAVSFSEVGTSFGDLTTSVLILLALYSVLRILSASDSLLTRRHVIACGLGLGLAAGLKLTNACFAVPILCCLPFFLTENRLRVTATAAFWVCVGLLLTHGWWSFWLWLHYGNPLFPYFNGIFKSPYFPEISFFDVRFFPRNLIESVFYPFYFSWLPRTAELPFRDFRFPLGYVCVILVICYFVYSKVTRRPNIKLSRPFGFLAAFMVLAYL
ncbi:MAG: hypothetical protein V1792_00405 [Pseudomonadota bacterium]